MISAVDDSENVFVVFANEETKTTNVRQISIKKLKQGEEAKNQQSISLHNKHFFGMGYPYFITGYANNVAVTSDYGVLLFSVE